MLAPNHAKKLDGHELPTKILKMTKMLMSSHLFPHQRMNQAAMFHHHG